MVPKTIPFASMERDLLTVVSRSSSVGPVPAFFVFTLVILDLAEAISGGRSLSLSIAQAVHNQIYSPHISMDTGYVLVLMVEALGALIAYSFMSEAAVAFIPATFLSIFFLQAPRSRRFRAFMIKRIPLIAVIFIFFTGSIGPKLIPYLAERPIGGWAAFTICVASGWMLTGLTVAAFRDRFSILGTISATAVQTIAVATQAYSSALPQWIVGIQIILFICLTFITFCLHIEGARTHRVIISCDGPALPSMAKFSSSDLVSPTPTYVRFNSDRAHLIVMTRGKDDDRFVFHDTSDEQKSFPIHDRSLLVWNVTYLAEAIKGPIQLADKKDFFRIKLDIGVLPTTLAFSRGRSTCRRRVIEATNEVLFKNADLRGLIVRAVGRAFIDHVGDYQTDMEATLREIERDRFKLKEDNAPASSPNPATDVENKISVYNKALRTGKAHLDTLHKREIRLAEISENLTNFGDNGQEMLERALVAELEKRSTLGKEVSNDMEEAIRVIQSLGIRFNGVEINFSAKATEILATCKKAIEELTAKMDRIEARKEQAEDRRAALLDDAARENFKADPLGAGGLFKEMLKTGKLHSDAASIKTIDARIAEEGSDEPLV